ncbi:hypothetical protein D9758_008675 [Tetrapyrgos nigripes]|uniref:Heterokaryon incompatibility domain-containing protein n=1 Tax=Tetrapyrgos nigripes TaxID=182062 RepID=A0A8H5FYL5_9AGAR|nr:hypothetical protein D9758_008675 [Tetrapyrgos nigripes]
MSPPVISADPTPVTTPVLDPLQKRTRPRRLINTCTRKLEEFPSDDSVPCYAILSHRWEAGQEISYQEMVHLSDTLRLKSGYKKIVNACNLARQDGHAYIWIDTCCINSGDHGQRSQDINSMFNYYEHSGVCLVYLHDYTTPPDSNDYLGGPIDSDEFDNWKPSPELEDSTWFSRGWTLQELLAPPSVLFITAEWKPIRVGMKLLCSDIQRVTGISVDVLVGREKINTISIVERMSWAINRQTTKEEDRAYCLLGLLDVTMESRYGEGVESAFERLSNVLHECYPDRLEGVPKTGRDIMEYLSVKNAETQNDPGWFFENPLF